MQKSHLEFASSIVATSDEFLGEAYADRSAEFNTSLRGSETSPAEAVQNRELLDKIVAKLPHSFESGFRQYIEAESAAEVRWLQASVVWSNPNSTFLPTIFSMPSFVIGSTEQGRKTQLLIHGLYQEGDVNPYETNAHLKKRGALQTADISSRRYKRWHPDVQPTATSELSVEELNDLYGRGGYVLGEDDSRLPILRNRNLSKPLNGITNEMLARYSVFEHIGGLLLAFDNAKQEVKDVIATATAVSEEEQ